MILVTEEVDCVNFHETGINSVLANLEMAYEYLAYANRDLQDPYLRKEISSIKKSISSIYNQLESNEVQSRTSLEEKERQKRFVESY